MEKITATDREIEKIEKQVQKLSQGPGAMNQRLHANWTLLVLVMIIAAVFISAAVLYHLQLGYFYNKLVDKDTSLNEMEETLESQLSRRSEDEETLKAKSQYEIDLSKKFQETTTTGESLQTQIKDLAELLALRENRASLEQTTFKVCDKERDLLEETNVQLKETLLNAIHDRDQVKSQLDECEANQ